MIRNTKFFCDLFSGYSPRNIACSYLSNHLPRNSCSSIVLPGMVSCNKPSLFNHIISVVLGSSKKQVIRIYARAKVAFVKNEHSIRYDPKMDYPRSPVCGDASRAFKSRNTSVWPLMLLFPSCPFPAVAKHWVCKWTFFIYTLPKSVWKCWGKTLLSKILKSNNLIHQLIGGSGFVFRQPGPLPFRRLKST